MPRSKVKGGGTKKVCLPYNKYKSMSKAERQKVIRAKRKAAAQGKYKRSSKSNVKVLEKKVLHLETGFKKNAGLILPLANPAENNTGPGKGINQMLNLKPKPNDIFLFD